MNRKGIMLIGILMAFALALCLFLLSDIKLDAAIKSGDVSLTKYIGDMEISTIAVYQNGEKMMLYIDQAAKYSAEKAITELALSQSAINELSMGCGQYNGYTIYQDFDKTTGQIKDCFPPQDSVEENFLRYFNSNLNDYLRTYYLANLSLDNYIYSIRRANNGITLLGIALQNPNLTLQPKEEVDESKFFNALQEMADKDTYFWQPGSTSTSASSSSGATGSENLVSIRSGFVGLCIGTCALTKDVAESLKKAEDTAEAAGYKLYVYESWRSEESQRELWDKYGHDPARVCGPDASGSFLHCPHNTGLAVDIAFLGLPMTDDNYKELEKIMCRAGWVRYSPEPWHFEVGSDRWKWTRGTSMSCSAGACSNGVCSP